MYPHVLGEIMRLTGCSLPEAVRAVDAVGMDVTLAVEWLREHAVDR